MLVRSLVLVLVSCWSVSASAQTCRWGGFDGTRIHKPAGFRLDTGVYLSQLRAEITNAGGVVVPGTPTLTSAYLAQCDVFFTSILADFVPVLSDSEKTALAGWLASGGTLIVSGLQTPLAFYDSFTSPYGVTNYLASIGQQTLATSGGSHPLISGVNTVQANGHCSFSAGPQGLVLATDASGGAFMAVLEPSTGFSSGGRIFVFGDAESIDDLEIGNADHAVLMKNMVAWGCTGGCPGYFLPYGTSCVGAAGLTPTLSGEGCATPGDLVQIKLQDAAPNRTSYTLIGIGQGAVPVNPGCLLQNAPFLPQVFVIPIGAAGQWTLATIIPAAVTTPDDVYLQTFIDDPGAPFGVSATRPLRVHLDA